MPKWIKWILITAVGLMVLVILAVLIAPMVINFEKYKPQIEAQAARALGRPVTLGGRIEPSVFPWIGVTLSDVYLGNPPGFEQKDFVSIGLLEVRIKLLPLLVGKYQIKRFVLKAPQFTIVRKKDGHTNLEGLGGTPSAAPAQSPPNKTEKKSPLVIKDLRVNEFAITGGRMLYIDQAAGSQHEIKDIHLLLGDVSLQTPIRVDFSAVADQHPLALTGSIGPLGTEIGKQPLPIDLAVELLKEIKIKLQGQVIDPLATPKFEMNLQVAPFSPRKVLADLKQPLPFAPSDPNVLNKLALSSKLSGNAKKVDLSDGKLTLDDSQMTFQVTAQAFDKPDVKLQAKLDQINLDRYLPAPSAEKPSEPQQPQKAPPKTGAPQKTDYTPLRRLVLDAQLTADALQLKHTHMQNVVLKATAKDGIIRLDPFKTAFYKGVVSAAGTLNVQQNEPRGSASFALSDIQAGPFIKDLMAKEIVEGVLTGAMEVRFAGDTAEAVQKSLDGKGEFKFTDGAIVGIDLAAMVRNVQTAFGLAEKPTEKPRTDFSELVVPLTITNGVAQLENARLISPLLRVSAGGKADLAQKVLDIRIEPKFVTTLVGQGDTQQRSGIMVPVFVRGTFDKPKYIPDVKSILNQQLPTKEELKKLIPPKEELNKDLEKKAGDLLKGLFNAPKQKE